MTLKNIQRTIGASAPMRELVSRLAKAGGAAGAPAMTASGIAGSLTAFVAVAIREGHPAGLLMVVPAEEGAETLRDDCASLAGAAGVTLFGARPLHQAQSLDVSASIAQVETLEALSSGKKPIVVTSARALSEAVPAPASFRRSMVAVKKGADHPFDGLLARLDESGFERKDFVGGYGEYSVRGGIVDVYPYSGDNPLRIEFWGDRVESIREFDPMSQRSIRELDSASIVPNLPAGSSAGEGGPAPGASILDYLDPGAVVILSEPDLIRAEFDEMTREGITPGLPYDEAMQRIGKFTRVECLSSARGGDTAIDFGSAPQPSFNGSLDALLRDIRARNRAGIAVHLACGSETETRRLETLLSEHGTADGRGPGPFGARAEGPESPGGTESVRADRRVDAAAASSAEIESAGEEPSVEAPAYTILPGSVHAGFVFRPSAIALYTEHEVFGRQKQRGLARRRRFKGITQKELLQLQKGDFVVHADHGVGKFAGLTKIRVGGAEQEVMRILFLEEDTLYVNLNFVNRVQKYTAGEGHAPVLHRLGGGEWDRAKSKAKKRIKDLARDIIALYARRKAEQGFAFSPDSHWQHEMEASFLFEDTPDQATATADVKKDMEASSPMDRLICGDVGFGKTEVAVRAAFKAALDGKQTAVLVPTTILAHQHYNTFRDRLARFSVRIENLTRFKTKKEQAAVVAALGDGGVDVVIGTHRLISKDVRFRDLGLLVIDEEHRFGVGAKEKLRGLKATVDTLAMTATPIPRTLQFSLIGSRDLSLITTPPRNRLPVTTEIVPAAAATREPHREVIREALVRELHRGGQAYFVHDRVSDLEAVAAQLKAVVPEAKIQVAHGQMAGHELEQAMLSFMEKRSNVLLCTKIIESGLDIPNVNTIIINRADRFGLAELYQLRGRVGRSSVQGYAYLLVPPLSGVPKGTLRRLQALEEFTELGSGFNLAMRDLEIRGAGNLLGGEQSGFIAEMGFETYERIILEAVDELKREEFAGMFSPATPESHPLRAAESVVDADVEAIIPEVYVDSDTERLDLYRRLYRAAGADELEGMRAELADRFGEYPVEVENLLRVVALRQAAAAAGLPRAALSGSTLTLTLPEASDARFYGTPEEHDSPFQRLMARIAAAGKKTKLDQRGKTLTVVVSGIAGASGAERLASALAAVRDLTRTAEAATPP